MAMELAPCNKIAKGVILIPSSSSSCFITNLPDSILMKILCKLPIKTLAAYKSVCKSWLHLIRDPHFSQLLQARAPTQVFFQYLYGIHETKLYMGSFNDFDVKLNTLFEFPRFVLSPQNVLKYNMVLDCVCFVNACNGLLFYYVKTRTERYAVVWNPCTSEGITFPTPYIHEGFPNCRGYGLGFSVKANKFKLLRWGDRKVTRSGSVVAVVAEVCTIEKACSWKIVDQLPVGYPIEGMSSGVFLGSTLNWAISHNEISILTFDFERDRFGRIQPPPEFGKTLPNWDGEVEGEGESESSCREILGVLGGCLVITDNTNQGATVWLMKEYGVEDSWTKVFCFRHRLHEELDCVRSCLPITFLDNSEILMKCTHTKCSFFTVFSYNPLVERVRVIGSCYGCLSLIAFRPSLVLLKDCVLGYKVQVKSTCVVDREMFTTPSWGRPSMGGWEG